MLPELTVTGLTEEAGIFAEIESAHHESALYGVTDGKRIGTYFEHKFQAHLAERYRFERGSSASGVDFPGLNVDMKVTRITQPQSSSPYKNARQKIYGLGYSLLVFVYQKTDDISSMTGNLYILHTVLVESHRTADYQTTSGIQRIIGNNGNVDDILAFLEERRLPVDEIEGMRIAEQILDNPPDLGYLTISNALQWRLQYNRILSEAGNVAGIIRVR